MTNRQAQNPAELSRLNAALAGNPADESLLIARGRLHWALGNRSHAINDWLAAKALNPSSPAAQLIENAQAILDFRNNDLYNP